MLKLLYNIRDLNYSQLLDIYRETIEASASESGRISAEQAFYDDLCCFFQCSDVFFAVWEEEGQLVSCVRGEFYDDGILLSCLETAPEQRRRGYASLMLNALVAELRREFEKPIYVHVQNNNKASLILHTRLGFHKCLDYGRLVDGTVTRQYCTMKYE